LTAFILNSVHENMLVLSVIINVHICSLQVLLILPVAGYANKSLSVAKYNIFHEKWLFRRLLETYYFALLSTGCYDWTDY
jgi:hypothetical protein